MSTSQILDRTFQLYRSNFVLFAGIAVVPPAMTMIWQLAALGGGAVFAKVAESSAGIVAVVLGSAMLVVLYLVGTALATGATVHAVSRVHLGSPVTIMESYRAVSRLVWRIIGIIILVALMAGGAALCGYIALIALPLVSTLGIGRSLGNSTPLILALGLAGFATMVAAFVFGTRIYCRYALAVPGCVVEQLQVMASLRRSKFLTHKSLFQIFLIYLLLGILEIALGAALSIPNYIQPAVTQGQPPLPFQIWSFMASFLAGTLAGPIGTIAIALVYYDQRVRREAFDLQLMMEAAGQLAPPQVAASPPAPASPPALG
jgi:hypothetical protein